MQARLPSVLPAPIPGNRIQPGQVSSAALLPRLPARSRLRGWLAIVVATASLGLAIVPGEAVALFGDDEARKAIIDLRNRMDSLQQDLNRRLEAVVDPQHLQQVVWNLVQNALRYGRQPSQPARVAVVARVAVDKGPPLIEVIDRGPGIPPKVAAQIFEPFYTTHEYGTGLGLYLAKQMSEASQATLEYVPIAGGGACFRITLQSAANTLAGQHANA